MTFQEIYDRIIPLWGNAIDFSDGKIDREDKSYFFSQNFSNLWDQIENKVETEDRYGELMVWTMYQTFHSVASRLFIKGVYTLEPITVSKHEIEVQFFENLNNEGWEEQLESYVRT